MIYESIGRPGILRKTIWCIEATYRLEITCWVPHWTPAGVENGQRRKTAWQSSLSRVTILGQFSLIDFDGTFFCILRKAYLPPSTKLLRIRLALQELDQSPTRFAFVEAAFASLGFMLVLGCFGKTALKQGQQSFILHTSLFPWPLDPFGQLTKLLGKLKVELVLLSALAILCDLYGIVKSPFQD